MKKLAVLMFVALSPIYSLACSFDTDCGYGNACVKEQGAMTFQGVCVHYNNAANNPYANDSSAGAHEASTKCQSDYDCGYGASCIKRGFSFYGMCVK